jgi:hypothetical protein
LADFIFVFSDESLHGSELTRRQSVVDRKLDSRSNPELGFTLDVMNVNVQTRLLAGEEIEAEATGAKHRRAHDRLLITRVDVADHDASTGRLVQALHRSFGGHARDDTEQRTNLYALRRHMTPRASARYFAAGRGVSVRPFKAG